MLQFNPEPSKTFLPAYKRKSTDICLKPKFNNEAIAESIVPHYYLTDEERAPFRVDFINGQFMQNSQPLYGAYLYVLMPNGTLYCVPDHIALNHSHLSAGKPVKAAGMLYCRNGRMITMSNESGHYQPEPEEMTGAFNWFHDTAGYPFVFEDHSAQQEGEKLNGVRYFYIDRVFNCLSRIQIDLADLAKILCHLDGEMNYEEQVANNDLVQIDSSDDSPNCYYSFLSPAHPSVASTLKGMDANFYNQLPILNYTFLGYRKNKNAPFSRFGGILRQMRHY